MELNDTSTTTTKFNYNGRTKTIMCQTVCILLGNLQMFFIMSYNLGQILTILLGNAIGFILFL